MPKRGSSEVFINPGDTIFGKYERRAIIECARDLGYPVEVRDRLREAKTRIECRNIMTDARRKYL